MWTTPYLHETINHRFYQTATSSAYCTICFDQNGDTTSLQSATKVCRSGGHAELSIFLWAAVEVDGFLSPKFGLKKSSDWSHFAYRESIEATATLVRTGKNDQANGQGTLAAFGFL